MDVAEKNREKHRFTAHEGGCFAEILGPKQETLQLSLAESERQRRQWETRSDIRESMREMQTPTCRNAPRRGQSCTFLSSLVLFLRYLSSDGFDPGGEDIFCARVSSELCSLRTVSNCFSAAEVFPTI
jgi:hypothetical protein